MGCAQAGDYAELDDGHLLYDPLRRRRALRNQGCAVERGKTDRRCAETEASICLALELELAPPSLEKCSFRERRRSVDRAHEMRERSLGITGSTVELAPRRVPRIIAEEPRRT